MFLNGYKPVARIALLHPQLPNFQPDLFFINPLDAYSAKMSGNSYQTHLDSPFECHIQIKDEATPLLLRLVFQAISNSVLLDVLWQTLDCLLDSRLKTQDILFSS